LGEKRFRTKWYLYAFASRLASVACQSVRLFCSSWHLPAVEPRGRGGAWEPERPVGPQRLARGGHALGRVRPAPRPRKRDHRGSARRRRRTARPDATSSAAEKQTARCQRTAGGARHGRSRCSGAGGARAMAYLGWRLHAANEPTDRAMGARRAKEKAIGSRERRRASSVRALSCRALSAWSFSG